MDLRFAAQTDIGRHRLRNEDRCLVVPDHQLFGVADGVGGLPGGETASSLACETIERTIGQAASRGGDLEAHARQLVGAVHRANEAVVASGWQISPATGIATTVTAARFVLGHALIAHVGDSRCYAWSGGRFKRVTEDHNEMHALTRCVGQRQPLSVDLIRMPAGREDRFLFCTDGMSGEVGESELAVLTGQDKPPADILRELVAVALARGGPDNISAVLVCIG